MAETDGNQKGTAGSGRPTKRVSSDNCHVIFLTDLLIGPFRGAVFHHGGMPENCPSALVGVSPPEWAVWPTLMGRFPECLHGHCPLEDCLENSELRKWGIKRFLICNKKRQTRHFPRLLSSVNILAALNRQFWIENRAIQILRFESCNSKVTLNIGCDSDGDSESIFRDSTAVRLNCLLLAAEFLAIPAHDSRNRAIRDSVPLRSTYLSISQTCLPWSDLWVFAKVPNQERPLSPPQPP